MQRDDRIEAMDDVAPSRRSVDMPALEAGLGFRLSRLTRALRVTWARELAEVGLSPPAAAVLRGVAGRPGCSLRGLARLLGTEPMAAKRCVDDLEGRGLLASTHRGADRRPRGLELTGEGQAVATRLAALVARQEARFDQALGPERRDRLEEAITVLESELEVLPFGTTLLGGQATATAPSEGRDRS